MILLDLCTFDPGIKATSPAAFAAEVADCVEASWDSGADIVLLPEFAWMGLEPLVPGKDMRGVADVFWQELFPSLATRLHRPDKAVVLGTVPFAEAGHELLRNRAPILTGGRVLHQDKLHLTPWEAAFRPGEEQMIWEFAGLTLTVVICLDVEIPETSARLRGAGVDLILVPSATETVLGVERVDRCASARAVELGCVVGVSHLTGHAQSALIDENVGRTAVYFPSQASFRHEPRWVEGPVVESGIHKQRVQLDKRLIERMRRIKQETNPSLLAQLPAFEVVRR